MNKLKTIATVSMVVCIVLASTLVGVVLSLQSSLQQTNEKIDALSEDLANMHRSYKDELAGLNQQLNNTKNEVISNNVKLADISRQLNESKEEVADLMQKINNFEENYYFP